MNPLETIKGITPFLEMIGATQYDIIRLDPEPCQLPILVALLEEVRLHGGCPSLVMDCNDPEYLDITPPFRKHLMRVTLSEHVVEVCRAVLQDIRMSCRHIKDDLLDELIMALAMDLGKIPSYRESGLYGTREHQLVSALKLADIESRLFSKVWYCGSDSLIIKGIKGHRIRGLHWKSEILRKADMAARKAELLQKLGFREAPLREWLDTNELVGRLAPKVNHLRGGKWQAFSHKGVVYVRPDFLYKVVLKLAVETGVVEVGLIYYSEKETIIREVVDLLREAGQVPILRKDRCAAKFDIRGPFGVNVSVVTPLRGELFDRYEIEKRKAGYLESIRYVNLHKGLA
jgi:hypothetical protein